MHNENLLGAPLLRELGGRRDGLGERCGDGSSLKDQISPVKPRLGPAYRSVIYSKRSSDFLWVGKASRKEVGHVEQGRNVETDALNLPSRFLLQPSLAAGPLPSLPHFHPSCLSRGRGNARQHRPAINSGFSPGVRGHSEPGYSARQGGGPG